MSNSPWSNAAAQVGSLVQQQVTAISANSIVLNHQPSSYSFGTVKFRGDDAPPFISISGSPERPLEANMDGPLPQIGERVELVCVSRGDNEMGFALRVIPESYK
jgi:hypothetical protein